MKRLLISVAIVVVVLLVAGAAYQLLLASPDYDETATAIITGNLHIISVTNKNNLGYLMASKMVSGTVAESYSLLSPLYPPLYSLTTHYRLTAALSACRDSIDAAYLLSDRQRHIDAVRACGDGFAALRVDMR